MCHVCVRNHKYYHWQRISGVYWENPVMPDRHWRQKTACSEYDPHIKEDTLFIFLSRNVIGVLEMCWDNPSWKITGTFSHLFLLLHLIEAMRWFNFIQAFNLISDIQILSETSNSSVLDIGQCVNFLTPGVTFSNNVIADYFFVIWRCDQFNDLFKSSGFMKQR